MRRLFFLFLFGCFLPPVRAEIQVIVTIDGATGLSASRIPPAYTLTEFDDSTIDVQMCPYGTFSDDHSGVCRACSVCVGEEYAASPCVYVKDTQCSNCTVCREHEEEICHCTDVTSFCYTGNRVCYKLLPMTINLTVTLQSAAPLTKGQLRLVSDGLGTGYLDWLSGALQIPNATYDQLVPGPNRTYIATFTLFDVYNQTILHLVETGGAQLFEGGIVYTFGVYSGLGRRRLLAYASGLVTALGVGAVCQAGAQCPKYTVQDTSGSTCGNLCVGVPCPAGATGDFGICTTCPNATYKNASGNASCIDCQPWYTSPMGATSVEQCVPGPTTTGVFVTTLAATAGQTAPVVTAPPVVTTVHSSSLPRTTPSVPTTTRAQTPQQTTQSIPTTQPTTAAQQQQEPTSGYTTVANPPPPPPPPGPTAAGGTTLIYQATTTVQSGSGGGSTSSSSGTVDFNTIVIDLLLVSISISVATAMIASCACGYVMFSMTRGASAATPTPEAAGPVLLYKITPPPPRRRGRG